MKSVMRSVGAVVLVGSSISYADVLQFDCTAREGQALRATVDTRTREARLDVPGQVELEGYAVKTVNPQQGTMYQLSGINVGVILGLGDGQSGASNEPFVWGIEFGPSNPKTCTMTVMPSR